MEPFAWSFVGSHEHKLDGQHRFSFPGEWRSDVVKSEHGRMIAFLETELNPQTQEESAYMAILPNDVVQSRVAKLTAMAFERQDGSEEKVYDAFARAETLSWDSSGRITLPKKFAGALGVKPKEKGVVVLTGRLNTIHLRTKANADRRTAGAQTGGVNPILSNVLPSPNATGTDNSEVKS